MKFACFRHGYFWGKIGRKRVFRRASREIWDEFVKSGDDVKKPRSAALKMLCFGGNFFALFIFAMLAYKPEDKYQLCAVFAAVAGLNFAYSFTTMDMNTSSRRVFSLASFFRQAVIFCNTACLALICMMYTWRLFIFEHGEGRWAVFMCAPYLTAWLLAFSVRLRYGDPRGIELARAALFSPREQKLDTEDVAFKSRGREAMARADFYKSFGKKSTNYGLLLLLFAVYAGYRTLIEPKSPFVLAMIVLGVCGFLLICTGISLSRKGLKLGKRGLLEFFAVSQEEISDIEKNSTVGDTQDMRLQAVFIEYRNRHVTQIREMEELFDRLMTKNYGFTSEFTRSLRTRNIGKYPISEAVFWHREYMVVERIAESFYKKYSTVLGLNDPAIFVLDIKTGKPVERSKEAIFWVWLLRGKVTTKGKIFAIIYGIVLVFLIHMKLRIYRLVP